LPWSKNYHFEIKREGNHTSQLPTDLKEACRLRLGDLTKQAVTSQQSWAWFAALPHHNNQLNLLAKTLILLYEEASNISEFIIARFKALPTLQSTELRTPHSYPVPVVSVSLHVKSLNHISITPQHSHSFLV
jgi:hypothetical protein